MPRTLPADAYGRSLAVLVERVNDDPTTLKHRIAELEDTVAVQAETIRKLRAELAAIEDAAHRQTDTKPAKPPAIPLTQWYRQNRMSYQKAYRMVASDKIPGAYQIGRQWFIPTE
jgi:hypothetical protein